MNGSILVNTTNSFPSKVHELDSNLQLSKWFVR
jgi:hypothetical protein